MVAHDNNYAAGDKVLMNPNGESICDKLDVSTAIDATKASSNGNSVQDKSVDSTNKDVPHKVNGVSRTAVPPDGGWGWVVAVSVSLANVLNNGHFKAFGLYVIPLMHLMDASATRVAWISSIWIGCNNCFSIIASTLTHMLSPRKVVMIGAFSVGTGFVVSSFARNLTLLYFTFGVCAGIGMSFTFTPGLQMIGFYFLRRRGAANGMSLAGNALGGILLPIIVATLLEEYGFRGTILIVGGLMLHTIVCAMLWHPVEWHQRKPTDSLSLENGSVPAKVQSKESRTNSDFAPTEPNLRGFKLVSLSRDVSETKQNNNTISEMLQENSRYEQDEIQDSDNVIKFSSSRTTNGVSKSDYDDKQNISNQTSNVFLSLDDEKSAKHPENNGKSFDNPTFDNHSDVFMNPQTLQSDSSVCGEKCQTNKASNPSLIHRKSALKDLGNGRSAVSNEKDIDNPKIKRKLIDFSLAREPMFWVIVLNEACTLSAYPPTQTFLPLRVKELGYSQQQAAMLLSTLAFSDLTGRLFISWLSDFTSCSRSTWYGAGMALSGVLSLILPFCHSIPVLSVAVAAFGFFSGSYVGLVASRISDIFGGQRVGMAVGLIALVTCPFSFIGAPMMGFILDRTGSYYISQGTAGILLIIGGISCVLECFIRRSQKNIYDMNSTVPKH